MLLYFPEKFDENEWTILFAVIFNILLFVFLPKRIPKEMTPLIVLLSMSFPKVMDHSMAVKPFSYYNLTDSPKYEIFDVILYGVYPAFGFLFVYLLDYFNFRGFRLVLYFLAWALFAGAFELLLVKLHVYVYTGWKIAYSLPVYIIVLALTFLFYKFIIHYPNHTNQQGEKSY